MELLHGSMRDLGHTLGRNRDRAAHQRDSDLDRRMREEEMGLRREDQQDARATRRAGYAAQQSHQQRMEGYQKQMLAAKTEEQKLAIWNDIVKSGAATQETLDAMGKAMSDKLGVEVKLQMPVKDRKPKGFQVGNQKGIYNPETGNFETEKPRAAGRRTLKIGADGNETITQDLSKEELDAFMAKEGPASAGGEADLGLLDTIKADTDVTEPRAGGGKGGRAGGLFRGGPVSRGRFVDEAMAEVERGNAIPAHGPPAAQAATGDRVTVIAPDGKRGTIPRAQLAEALKKGYKQAQ